MPSVGIRPSRLMARPVWPFRINPRSWEAQGLRIWIPLVPNAWLDVVGGGKGSFSTPMNGYTGSTRFGMMQRFGSVASHRLLVQNRIPWQFGTLDAGATLKQPTTISVWAIREQAPAATQTMVSCGTAGVMRLFVSSAQRFSYTAPSVVTAEVVAANVADTPGVGTLAHYVATDDGTLLATGAHLYVNGVETTYQTQTNGTATNSQLGVISVGSDVTANSPWIGSLTDLRVYNYPMSAKQVLDLYTRQPYWDLYDISRRVYFDVTAQATGHQQFLPLLGVA